MSIITGVREDVINIRRSNPCATLQGIADKVGVSRERIRQILESERLQTKHYKQKYDCLNCHNIFTPKSSKRGLRFCSVKCKYEYTHPLIICDNCGILFRKSASYIRRESKSIRYKGNNYCSRKCFGIVLGTTHGFKAHPEHRGVGHGNMQRLYDYEYITRLYTRRIPITDIAISLDIPYKKLERVIHNLHKNHYLPYMNNRKH